MGHLEAALRGNLHINGSRPVYMNQTGIEIPPMLYSGSQKILRSEVGKIYRQGKVCSYCNLMIFFGRSCCHNV